MDLQALYEQAVAARRNGNLAEAERRYREILAVSQPPEMLVNYANILSALNRKGEALKAYDAALAQRPGFFEGEFNRANLLMELGRLEEALAGYERAVAARADVPSAWNNRGAVLRRMHRPDAALASHDRALALAPGHVNALINRGMALKDLERTKEAEAAADAALALQPDASEALHLKSAIALETGRIGEAQGLFARLRQAAPNHPAALNGLARAAALACDWTTAQEITPALLDAARFGSALVQPMVLMGYCDDPALLRRAAETAIARSVPPHAPLPKVRYAHDRIRIVGLDARAQRLHVERREAAQERVARRGDLVAADVVRAMQDLPIEVRALDDVVIDDAERLHLAGERQEGGAAEAAGADDEDPAHAKYSSSEK